MKIISLFLSFILISGCAYLNYVKDPFTDIPNFHKVTETLYRGGQPKNTGFENLKKIGIKTVLSLRRETNESNSEKSLISGLEMNFHNIPLSIYKRPTDEQSLQFLEIILNPKNQPVFVYCKSGRDRAGAMIALYRVVVEQKGPKEAYKEAKNFGFWPYRGTNELKTFIHQLRDKKIFFIKAKELTK